MNRAFVNEDTAAATQTLPERLQSEHPNYITAAGLAHLRQQLTELDVRLEQLKQQPETPERAVTMEALARDQRYLSARIGGAIPVAPPARPERVSFGCRVVIEDADGSRSIHIVGEDEADAVAGRIAWTSPLARALQGAAVGDRVVWERPVGAREIEVMGITTE